MDGAARTFLRLRVQARHRADGLGRIEADFEAEDIAIELKGFVHIADTDGDVRNSVHGLLLGGAKAWPASVAIKTPRGGNGKRNRRGRSSYGRGAAAIA